MKALALMALSLFGQADTTVYDYNFPHLRIQCDVVSVTHLICGGGLMTPEQRSKVDCSHWIQPKIETRQSISVMLDGRTASVCSVGKAKCSVQVISHVDVDHAKVSIMTDELINLNGNDKAIIYSSQPTMLTDAAGDVDISGNCSVADGRKYIRHLIEAHR